MIGAFGGLRSLGPSTGEARRADLVQSLYAHLCTGGELATRAAECLVSLCGLWCRTERHRETKGRDGWEIKT